MNSYYSINNGIIPYPQGTWSCLSLHMLASASGPADVTLLVLIYNSQRIAGYASIRPYLDLCINVWRQARMGRIYKIVTTEHWLNRSATGSERFGSDHKWSQCWYLNPSCSCLYSTDTQEFLPKLVLDTRLARKFCKRFLVVYRTNYHLMRCVTIPQLSDLPS